MNIVALLLLLLLRRTAATVLEHVLPVLFALSFLCPTVAHLDHIQCTSSWSSWSSPCTRRTRVRDTRSGGGFRVSLRPPLPSTKLPLASTRTKSDSSGMRRFVLPAGKTTPARGRRRGRERRLSQSGKGKERKTRAKNDSKHQLYARQKREREREKKPFERAVAERVGRVTVDFARRFPAQILIVLERTSRARSARIVSRKMTSFENNNNAYFASPFVRNWLLRAAGDEDGDQISCEIAHRFDDVSFRCELHSSTASKDRGKEYSRARVHRVSKKQ